MGQYHKPASLDKGESIHAHRLGNGLKLMEWGYGGPTGVTAALALFIGPKGRWHGDRIVVVGDYAEPGDIPQGLPFADDPSALYSTDEGDPDDHYIPGPCTQFARCTLAEAFGATYSEEGFHSEVGDWPMIKRLYTSTTDDGMYVVNVDRNEYLDPEYFGCGRSLPAIAVRQDGPMTMLAILLAVSNGRGGGDFNSEDPIVGSWGSQRVVIGPRPSGCGDISKLIGTTFLDVEGRYLGADESWDVVGRCPEWLEKIASQ